MLPCFSRAGSVLGGGVDPAAVVLAQLDGSLGAGVLAGLGVAAAWWWERRRRLRSEAKLRAANDRLRVLFDESPLSICVFDPHDREVPYRIVECNQHACDLHGRTREELVGRGMEVLTPLRLTYDDAQRFLARLRAGTCRGENPHRRKDGSVFDIEYVARLVVIDGHEYMIGVDRDLTAERERRASEERLRDTAELNDLVLRASNDGIWDWDVVADRIRYSDRCRQMLGYSKEELPDVGERWLELLHPEDEEKRPGVLRRHWEEGAPYVFQYRAKHKDGNWRWIVSRGITLFDANKRPLRMVGSRTDITEMKRLDAELLQGRKLRAVGEMVGGIAHEFNNLLTPMSLHAEMLEVARGEDAQVAGHLKPIQEGIERARELTQRILTFGRRSVESCGLLALEAVVRENLEFLSKAIDRRIQVRLTAPDAPAWVWANRSDLNQLVVNLILNARDTLVEKAEVGAAGEWVPRLEISLTTMTRASGARDNPDHHTPRRWRRLTVRDNGKGISEEVRERVFEPFFTTKEVGQGTGLGLATAWHVSMALGGWIEIESEPDEGTAFHIYIPAMDAAAGGSPDSANDATPNGAGGNDAAHPRRRVLLVEDNELVAYASQRMIESLGHDVRVFTTGQAALDELAARPDSYDVVLTDLNLPVVSGLELMRRLRAGGWRGRVVVCSGYFPSEHKNELLALEVDCMLQKPFTRSELAPVLS